MGSIYLIITSLNSSIIDSISERATEKRISVTMSPFAQYCVNLALTSETSRQCKLSSQVVTALFPRSLSFTDLVARLVEMRTSMSRSRVRSLVRQPRCSASSLLRISTRISGQYVVGVPEVLPTWLYQPLLASGDRLWCVGDISLWPHASSVCDLRSTRLPNSFSLWDVACGRPLNL